MTNEERDIIARFISRVGGAASGGFGSVPGTQPALPPIDPQADSFIREQFDRYPEARYRITQMAFVQEAALQEAQNRIQQMQWELEQAKAQINQQRAPSGRGGLFGGLFGGGAQGPQGPQQPQYQPPPYQPPPQYAPGVAQPGMFQRGGSGFLGSALTTAAGVAGGMMAGNALMSLFSGHHGSDFGGFGAGGLPNAPAEVVNNYYGDASGAAPGVGSAQDPWGGAGVGGADQGNGYWSKDDVYANNAPGGSDAPAQGGTWSDAGGNDAPQWDHTSDPGWGDAGASGGGWDDSGDSWT